jgi:hypothetical protein
MPMDSVSEENVEKLLNDYDRKQKELAEIKAMSYQQMWLRELDALEQEYVNYRTDRDIAINGLGTKLGTKKVVSKKVGGSNVVSKKKILLEIE